MVSRPDGPCSYFLEGRRPLPPFLLYGCRNGNFFLQRLLIDFRKLGPLGNNIEKNHD